MLKLWVRLSQGVLARGGDVAAAVEVECLEIRTSSCYFHHTGVCDASLVNFYKFDTQKKYFILLLTLETTK